MNSVRGRHPNFEQQFSRLFCDRNNEVLLKKNYEGRLVKLVGYQPEVELNHLLYRMHFLFNLEKLDQKTTHKSINKKREQEVIIFYFSVNYISN